jgi:hypothetical protein
MQVTTYVRTLHGLRSITRPRSMIWDSVIWGALQLLRRIVALREAAR